MMASQGAGAAVSNGGAPVVASTGKLEVLDYLRRIEDGVHAAVDLAASRGAGHEARADVRAILRSSADAVRTVLNAPNADRMTDDDRRAAEDLAAHIRNLITEMDNGATAANKPERGGVRSRPSSAARSRVTSTETHTSPAGGIGLPPQGAAEESRSGPSSARVTQPSLAVAPPSSSEEERGVVAHSPVPRRNSTHGERSDVEGSEQDRWASASYRGTGAQSSEWPSRGRSGSAVANTAAARTRRPSAGRTVSREELEALLLRTERVVERSLLSEAAHAAERSAWVTERARLADALASQPTAGGTRTAITPSRHVVHGRLPAALAPRLDQPPSPTASRYTGLAAADLAADDGPGLSSSSIPAAVQGADTRQAAANAEEAGPVRSVSASPIRSAGTDAVEIARLRGELAVARQRVAAAQADADHARASRDEAERALAEEKRLRAAAMADASELSRRLLSVDDARATAVDRVSALQKALQESQDDADAAAAAARVRETEAAAAAAEATAAAVRAERARADNERTTALAAAQEDKTAAVAAVEARLSAERTSHDETRAALERTQRTLAAAQAEIERLRTAVSDAQDALMRTRTEAVALNARIGGLNSMLAQREGELTAMRDRASALERDLDAAHASTAAREQDLRDMSEQWLQRLAAAEERTQSAETRAAESEALAHDVQRACERLRRERDTARSEVDAAHESAVQAKEVASAAVANAQSDTAAAKAKLTTSQQELANSVATEKRLRETLGETQAALTVSQARRDAAEQRLQEALTAHDELRARTHAETSSFEEQRNELSREIESLRAHVRTLSGQLDSERHARREDTDRLEAALKAATAGAENARRGSEANAAALNASLSEARDDIAARDGEIAELRVRVDALVRDLAASESARATANEKASRLAAELEHVHGSTQGEVQGLSSALDTTRQDVSQLTEQLERALDTIDALHVSSASSIAMPPHVEPAPSLLLQERIAQLEAALTEVEQGHATALEEARRASAEDAAFAMQKLAEAEGREVAGKEKIHALEASLTALQRDLALATDANRADKKRFERLEASMRDAEARIRTLVVERDEAVREMKALQARVASASDSSAAAAGLRDEVAGLKADAARASVRIESLTRQLAEAEATIAAADRRATEARSELSRVRRDAESVGAELGDMQRKAAALQSERDVLSSQVAALSAEVSRLSHHGAAARVRGEALAAAADAAEKTKALAAVAVSRVDAERQAAEQRAAHLEAAVRQLSTELSFFRAKDDARHSLAPPTTPTTTGLKPAIAAIAAGTTTHTAPRAVAASPSTRERSHISANLAHSPPRGSDARVADGHQRAMDLLAHASRTLQRSSSGVPPLKSWVGGAVQVRSPPARAASSTALRRGSTGTLSPTPRTAFHTAAPTAGSMRDTAAAGSALKRRDLLSASHVSGSAF